MFLSRSKRLLISWLQSPSAVILEPRKIKSDTVSTVSPSISHEVMGPDAMIFVFWMLSFKPTFSLSTSFFFFLNFILFLNFTNCIIFAKYQNESATGIHVFPILNPPPSQYHPSGSSQCTSPKHPVSCIEPGLATHFIYDIIHVSMSFSQIFPPSPSATESIRLFYTSVSLLLSRTQSYC